MTRQAVSNNPGRSKVRVVTTLWWLALLVMLAAWLGVVVGFAGRWWPPADSLSLLRIPLGVVCLLGAFIRFAVFVRVALFGAALATALTTLPFFLAGNTDGDLTIYTKNLWFHNAALPSVAEDIIATQAEVVMLQEVSSRNEDLLTMLKGPFPHQHLCRFSPWRSIAVLSSHPIASTRCSEQFGMAAAQITREGDTFWAASVHLHWPYPYENARSAQGGAALLASLEGPVVMAGDFNIFPWAASVQRLRRAGDMKAAGPLRPTFYLDGFPLYLDHVWAPGGGAVRYRPLLGSDHLGVLAVVDLDR